MLVEYGWITALGPADQLDVPAGVVQIDGRGKYLIPGLADMHVHMSPHLRNDVALGAHRLFLILAV